MTCETFGPEVAARYCATVRREGFCLGARAMHSDQLPGRNNISVEVADEAVVIGYPRGFYDQVNLFPIVKAGIIASRWGAPFQRKPYFLIDAKLFPGSSGSVVVSKPQNLTVVEGRLMLADERQFAFLGIFSGEPFFTGATSRVRRHDHHS